MSKRIAKPPGPPLSVTHEVRDACLCLHAHRAARALARAFDDAFRPLGLTHGQFSLLMSLNRPGAAKMSEVAHLLAMDRTTLTANLKPLARRGLVEITPDADDRRGRRLRLTDEGGALIKKAAPIWRKTHARIERALDADSDGLRAGLARLAANA